MVFGARNVKDVSAATYLIATYGAFGVIGASLFGFGVSVAIERGQGWLEAKRTTPMPIAAYFVAKLAMSMAFSAIIVLLLFFVGTQFGGVVLSFAQMAVLFAIFVTGSITFCALGLALGFLLGPNSAAPVVNLVYLPISVLSGLWMPIWFMPKPLQQLAYWLPPYHFSQLALHVTGGSRGESIAFHVLAMIGAAIVFGAIAYVGYRRDEGKLYG